MNKAEYHHCSIEYRSKYEYPLLLFLVYFQRQLFHRIEPDQKYPLQPLAVGNLIPFRKPQPFPLKSFDYRRNNCLNLRDSYSQWKRNHPYHEGFRL